MLRAIREIQPAWVVGENVFGIVSWDGGLVFEQVQADLEAEGYEVQPYVLPACAVNAPHRRDRVWFVAHTKCGTTGQDGCGSGLNGKGRTSLQAEDEGRKGEAVFNNGLRNIQGASADTESTGARENIGGIRGLPDRHCEGIQRDAPNAGCVGQEGAKQQTAGIKQCNKGNVADTDQERPSGTKAIRKLGRERFTKLFQPGQYWNSFPTVSPICDRNDGFSDNILTETISQEHRMDRTDIILKCLSEGRIETDPSYGKIYSRMIRGREGERVELMGSDCNGYIVHSLKYNGIKKQVKAHQVIWLSVNGGYDKNELIIDHINRVKTDNRIENLRLVNAKESALNREQFKGQFSDDDKDKMFLLHHDGHMSFREIAEDFGCSRSRVQQIVSEHKFNRLVGITFSKWRNESIKAMGNAIVPEVALQIFKAIEQYEKRNTTAASL